MSKKSKGSSAKKSSNKKAVKPVKKSSTTKAKAKKPAPAKKTVVKKTAKKVVAKKPAKTVKPKLKSKPKAAAKKVAPKKAAVKKVIAKKTAVKPVKAVQKPAKAVKVKTEAPKRIEIKKTEVKQAKPEIKSEKNIETTSKKSAESNKPQSAEVLAINNTIPKQEVSALSPSKIASISSSITNPVKKLDSYSVKVEKEPNGKFETEFAVRSSPEMLFEFLSTPSGLSEWFCDDVNIRNGIYTFIWDGQLQQARLLKTIDDQLVRFQWVDKTDGSYFEFRIQKDDLTNDTSLIITDFAETVSERESSKLLWQSQVEKLMHIIGSIF